MLKRPSQSCRTSGVLPRSITDMDPASQAMFKKLAADAFECMARHIADRLETFRISLKDQGKSLDNEQWLRFLQQLRRAEHGFVQKYWPDLELRLQYQIASDPLFASIQKNRGKWPECLIPSQHTRSVRKRSPRGDIARNQT